MKFDEFMEEPQIGSKGGSFPGISDINPVEVDGVPVDKSCDDAADVSPGSLP